MPTTRKRTHARRWRRAPIFSRCIAKCPRRLETYAKNCAAKEEGTHSKNGALNKEAKACPLSTSQCATSMPNSEGSWYSSPSHPVDPHHCDIKEVVPILVTPERRSSSALQSSPAINAVNGKQQQEGLSQHLSALSAPAPAPPPKSTSMLRSESTGSIKSEDDSQVGWADDEPSPRIPRRSSQPQHHGEGTIERSGSGSGAAAAAVLPNSALMSGQLKPPPPPPRTLSRDRFASTPDQVEQFVGDLLSDDAIVLRSPDKEKKFSSPTRQSLLAFAQSRGRRLSSQESLDGKNVASCSPDAPSDLSSPPQQYRQSSCGGTMVSSPDAGSPLERDGEVCNPRTNEYPSRDSRCSLSDGNTTTRRQDRVSYPTTSEDEESKTASSLQSYLENYSEEELSIVLERLQSVRSEQELSSLMKLMNISSTATSGGTSSSCALRQQGGSQALSQLRPYSLQHGDVEKENLIDSEETGELHEGVQQDTPTSELQRRRVVSFVNSKQ